jgi:hypothetical protein
MEPQFSWKIEPKKVHDIIKLIHEKQLILRPEYQRRSVWTKGAKSSLIETIITRKPIPFFLVSLDSKGILEVIDGQQRLRAISEFCNNSFALSGLDNSLLKGRFFNEFTKSLVNDIKRDIMEYDLYFVIIENATEDDIIDMYARVNKYTVNLNQQELRYAFYNKSAFLNLVENIAENEANQEFFASTGIFTERQIDRMGDLEFVSSIVTAMLDKQLGNKNESIENAYMSYESIEATQADIIKEGFQETINLIVQLFNSEIYDEYLELNVSRSPEFHIKKMRFKQKNDFLALFYVIDNLKVKSTAFLENDKLLEIQYFLLLMDWLIAPETEIPIFSDYAIKCVSQANTRSSREYRSKFIAEGIGHILLDTDLSYLNLVNIEPLNIYSVICKQTDEYLTSIACKSLPDTPSYRDIYETLLESNNA